ncbi:Scavenger receptor cysteine-rich type 1 M130 [Paramuricea clavata]|uniref:Scavenger receptor cysteine-rich type 1 M130 n=1 Tax=Paramuricea clavata TaxID=317549 RepID=A0A6S7FWZ4_PARCT|nr:Scavenger receptor cysteine-rich type 1 M130 [Paramuricea clavata]
MTKTEHKSKGVAPQRPEIRSKRTAVNNALKRISEWTNILNTSPPEDVMDTYTNLLNVEDDDENITIDVEQTYPKHGYTPGSTGVNMNIEESPAQAHESQAQEFRTNDIASLGASMIKYVNARKLRTGLNKNVTIKTFPGAGDMIHYAKPSLSKKPKHVIIHSGTNDLNKKPPTQIVKSIRKLGQAIQTENPDTNIIFSELIVRGDNKGLADKVREVNEGLDKLCKSENWEVLRNQNIKFMHLNAYGIHLTKQGTAILAKNIKTTLLSLDVLH